jgi:DNA ligase-1
MGAMQLARLAEVSRAVGATRSRNAKRDLIAELLRATPPDELEIATAWLSGVLRQRRTGVGWRGLSTLPPPVAEPDPGLQLGDVDALLERVATMSGQGSATARSEAVGQLFGRMTAPEQEFLRAVMTGQVRQGALDSVMLEAIAAAADLPVALVRRAAMFSAPTGPVAVAALTGGPDALAAFTLQVGRPIRPMLAGTATDVAAGVEKVGAVPLVVDTKLDGIRIQVHKDADDVRIFTRSLDEIAAKLPGVVAATRSLAARRLILDGEALGGDADGWPRPLQDTPSATATGDLSGDVSTDSTTGAGIRPFFFDLLLHDADGTDHDLLDEPLSARLAALDRIVPEGLRTARLLADDVESAAGFYTATVAAGQEGVILKHPDAPYAAGRRGSGWVKVKPRKTLDLVVLAVEWGSGRRRGWLSNIHLGARDPAVPSEEPGHWVMLGKTFKGMTDQMLAWQTERFLGLETHRDGHVVHVRPEQVVEIAFDGLQRSTRYPGGLALRFARVLRYRDDKAAEEADTVELVRSLA